MMTKVYNNHTHTHNSHDSKADIDLLCAAAIKEGLLGFAVTDHCDCEFSSDKRIIARIDNSVRETQEAKLRYSDRIIIGAGVEIGEILYNKEFADRIIARHCWDVILASVHAVRIKNFDMPFSLIDFSGWTNEQLFAYIRQYFADMIEMISVTDFDVLSHLTIPLRYISVKYGKKVDLEPFYDDISEILEALIKRDISLEINTSGCSDSCDIFYPDESILKMYRSLGGKRLSIGSDAHREDMLTNGLTKGCALIKSLGFCTLTYYVGRKPIDYKI